MRVLVTGGAGFIGSHLCAKLLDDGCDVICLDNYFSGTRNNVLPLLENPHFELMRHDIIQPVILEVDHIYHLACPASPVHYQYNPIKTIKTNVMGTLNMLGLAKRIRARILIASTSEVYGDPLVHPQTEEYWGNVNPIGLRACYDEGKRCAEALAFSYLRQNKVDVRVVRIFNTYGPNMHPSDGRVISNFIVQAIRNKPITIYGTGAQTRSFCYVSDLLRGFELFMNFAGLESSGPLNLGNPAEHSMLELAEMVKDLAKSTSPIEFQPLPQDDPMRRRPDISKAKRLLNWEPTVSVREGLARTIEYFLNRGGQ